MKVVIIEDELPQAQQLKSYLYQIDKEIEVLEILTSVDSSAKYLTENNPDLLFLDINLSDGLCFEIFNRIKIQCPVIFTTAYDQYAIQAFKHNGIDYLLKPILKEELENSIRKFKSFTNTSIDYSKLISSLKSLENKTEGYKKRFVAQIGKRLRIINDTEIAYFYAFRGSVYIKTNKGDNYMIEETLERIEDKLDPFYFFRINRKIIANISAIKEMHTYSKSRLKIELNPEFEEDVIVSYNNLGNFMKWIKK
jgi:DNA-binding LytR/AlgR family response regulator